MRRVPAAPAAPERRKRNTDGRPWSPGRVIIYNNYLVANSIPIYDEICRRTFNFSQKVAACDCNLINFIVCNGLYYCRMKSPFGRNAVNCCLRYGISIEMLWNTGLSKEFL